MFCLPLPFDNTIDTLQTVEDVIKKHKLPNPELSIIVDGTPTKSKVIWGNLVDLLKPTFCTKI